MKKLGFCIVGAAALGLAACGSNDGDTLNESEAQNYEAETLNELATNAAEIEALGNEAQQEPEVTAPEENNAEPPGNATDPSEVEEDVQGM